MQKLKSGSGYAWALFCLAVVLAMFVGLDFWAKTLADTTGLQISPRFSGGEVRQVIDHGTYKTLLHRMVFDGLIRKRSEGFVQIDWVPQGTQPLPSVLQEDLDIDGDGSHELSLRLNLANEKAELLHQTSWVIGVEPLITADAEKILRVRLRNPRK